jgi:hypothetical protein
VGGGRDTDIDAGEAQTMKLWKRFGGEPFLINPHLVSLNPKRKSGRKKMRRRLPPRSKSGRFLKRRTNAPRRRARRNAYFMNPRRRTRRNPIRRRARRNAYFVNPRRRRARRNPALFSGNRILGFTFQEILYTGAGFIAPPVIEGFLLQYLPATLVTNKIGKYAIKAGAVAALSFAGGKFLGREAGKYIAIGGMTYLVATLVIDFAPQLFSGFSGYMNPGATYTPKLAGMGSQPFLGAYHGIGMSPAKLPERVDPNQRF